MYNVSSKFKYRNATNFRTTAGEQQQFKVQLSHVDVEMTNSNSHYFHHHHTWVSQLPRLMLSNHRMDQPQLHVRILKCSTTTDRTVWKVLFEYNSELRFGQFLFVTSRESRKLYKLRIHFPFSPEYRRCQIICKLPDRVQQHLLLEL